MSTGATIDYDALAKQNGALSSAAPGVDYDALAKQNGAVSSTGPGAGGPGSTSKLIRYFTPGRGVEDAAVGSKEEQDILSRGGKPIPRQSGGTVSYNAPSRVLDETPQQNAQRSQIETKDLQRTAGQAGAILAGGVAPELLPEMGGAGGLLARAGTSALASGSGTLAGQTIAGANPADPDVLKEAGTNAAVAGGADLLLGGAGMGMSRLINGPKPPVPNVDEWKAINNTIGATQKSIRISPNASSLEGATTMPGRALSEAGLDSATLSKMTPPEQMKAIAPLWNKAGQAITQAVGDATDKGITVDVGKSAMNAFKQIKNPGLQESAIDSFNELSQEIGIGNQREATPAQARELRQALGEVSNFLPGGSKTSLATIRAQLYRAVSSDLQDAVPGLKDLDQRYSDLKSAIGATQRGSAKFAIAAPEPSLLSKVGTAVKKAAIPAAIGGAAGAGGVALYRMLEP